jgi:putative flippase GtrA
MTEFIQPLYAMTGFGLLGLVSFTLNLGLSALLHEVLGASEELSFGISLAVVFAVNFLACRYIIFDAAGGNLVQQLTAFTLSSLAFRGMEYIAFLLLHSLIGIHYLIAIITVLGVSMISKFFFYRSTVFVEQNNSKQAGS